MNHLGVEGYRAKQALVTRARETIEAGVRAQGFTVLDNGTLIRFHGPGRLLLNGQSK